MDEEVFNTTVLAKKRQSKEEFFQMEIADNSELQASMRMLPPNLYIQLDNSAKDNKNWAMMGFCSELVARGCCKMITMSFLVVGHTHEDVNFFFSKVNATQRGKDIESLPHFLAVVYHAQSSKAYPRVIQEVADYKEHVKDYMEKITGQSAPVAIRFYMQDNILVYQVQENYGGEWVPPYGRTVWKRCELESETNFQVVLPPRQDPVAKGLMCPHAKKIAILGYIRNYITYKKKMQLKVDPTSSHYWEDNALIQYWTNVSDVFQAGWPSEENQPLQESFWPSTNHGTGYRLGGPSTKNLALVLHHGEAQKSCGQEMRFLLERHQQESLPTLCQCVDGCNENSETEAPLGNGNPEVHAPRGSIDLDPLEFPLGSRERKNYLQRKRRYEQSISPERAEILKMPKEAECEAEEIKRRALEEAEAIRSSARLSGSPIRSTLRSRRLL
ncbi:hypothetical protein R1sor_005256 [Riccia sorocarpa]|uniref:DUF7869 domain-containing protein n=1 Tax=Riccia sorocarpa TaxID=122646 RepID=A0ABD3HIZ9_9MARC